MTRLFERKDGKKESLLDLDGRLAALEKKYNSIKESGEKLHYLTAVLMHPHLLHYVNWLSNNTLIVDLSLCLGK